MKSNRVTFGDLDCLLERKGFVRREHAKFLAYVHAKEADLMFLFPPRGLSEPADPHHVADVRIHLLGWGMIKEVEFDRWLCGVRFGDVCREPTGSAVAAGQDGRTAAD